MFRHQCRYAIGMAMTLFLWISPAMGAQSSRLETIRLKTGNQVIQAEVAKTEAERQQGLMHRKSLPANHGMLFVFDRPARSCMWMKDTPIPLSVAFINHQGIILNIEEMKPLTTDPHCSIGWIRYALEMNAQWFERHGLKPGSRIDGLPE